MSGHWICEAIKLSMMYCFVNNSGVVIDNFYFKHCIVSNMNKSLTWFITWRSLSSIGISTSSPNYHCQNLQQKHISIFHFVWKNWDYDIRLDRSLRSYQLLRKIYCSEFTINKYYAWFLIYSGIKSAKSHQDDNLHETMRSTNIKV